MAQVWKTPQSLLNGYMAKADDSITATIRLWPDLIARPTAFWIDDPMHTDNTIYDRSGDRFGRVVKEFVRLGELRRQKKAPHKEVFYTWVPDPKWTQEPAKKVLRSIVNCDNDQLTESIRECGAMIDTHQVSREEAEQVLDILYAELQRRTESAESIRAKRYKGEQPNARSQQDQA